MSVVMQTANTILPTRELLFTAKIMLDITEPQKAYIAGIIDGEGSITISRKIDKTMRAGVAYRPYVPVTNTDRRLLDWLFETTGLGNVRPNAIPKNPNHKPSWRWELWSQQAHQLLLNILPYLILKKEQAILLIEFMERVRYGVGRNGLTDDELKFQSDIYNKLVILNKRGLL